MSQILENIKTRRSVRAFKNEQISREQLDNILTAGLYAPSGMNRQPWQFTVIQDSEKLEKLRNVIATALDRPDYHRFYHAPTLILVSTPKDSPLGCQDSSVALENMLLAAHDSGLGSVWINQLLGICDIPEVRSLLTEFHVPENHVVWGSAAFGYAATEPEPDRENKGIVVYA